MKIHVFSIHDQTNDEGVRKHNILYGIRSGPLKVNFSEAYLN